MPGSAVLALADARFPGGGHVHSGGVEEAAARGLRMLDAPVSGGQAGAEAAALSIMVGGTTADFTVGSEVFDLVGRTVVHVGPNGAGQTVKAANQLVVAANIQALAEAVVFLEAHGADLPAALDVLGGGLAGSKVLVVGSESLAGEIDNLGLVPVRRVDEEPVAVVQGHSPDTGWWNLAEACLAIRGGATWVACNSDLTLPTERGQLPGNGAMVTALRAATGAEPQVAGKPERPLLDRAVDSAGAQRPLMIGDRLDTDIAGAVTYGMPSLLVLTGVGTPEDALFAPPELRPGHIAEDMRALLRPSAESAVGEHEAWKVRVGERALELSANSAASADRLTALRALCAAWWPVGSGRIAVQAGDARAEQALRELGLA